MQKYTKKLQEKEEQYQSEKVLRVNQLSQVLRTLLIFEARLRREQVHIHQQLQEKDFIIKKQKHDINYLMKNHTCKNCLDTFNSLSNRGSFDSSSECLGTECQGSNLESLESSCESNEVALYEQNFKTPGEILCKNSIEIPLREIQEFTDIKDSSKYLDNRSDSSDHFNNNYPNQQNEKEISKDNHVIENVQKENKDGTIPEIKTSIISEEISKFEENIGDGNDKWYTNTSDPEDDELKSLYRNNPVLECMNQILQQNINSPPKTPNVERKIFKKVKFIDENLNKNVIQTSNNNESNYYETPIQKLQNFYETPQSIYSNDYEQIVNVQSPKSTEKINEHNVKVGSVKCEQKRINERKTKLPRTPPALPPKPINLLPKYKINNLEAKIQFLSTSSVESEPDYCSISELNLPNQKVSPLKKINVVAEENIPNFQISPPVAEREIILHRPKVIDVTLSSANNLKSPTKKGKEYITIQNKEKSPVKTTPSKQSSDIPKLPQVAEIIIPDENEVKKTQEIISHDNYIKNYSQIINANTTKLDFCRKPLVIGKSVSNIIKSFNNQQIQEMQENFEKPKSHKKSYPVFEKNVSQSRAEKNIHVFNNFDYKQNFEEFKLDECEIMEEYNLDLPDVVSMESKSAQKKSSHDGENLSSLKNNVANDEKIIPAVCINVSNQLMKEELEFKCCKDLNEIQTTEEKSNTYSKEPTYEHFLECTGLSTKSILTPTRIVSNHKNVLKPKDVKFKSKLKSNLIDKPTSTIKYNSEPFI